METWRILIMAFYLTLAAGFISLFGYTFYTEPLFGSTFYTLEWCRLWLGTTVVDYHVIALSLSSIMIGTEGWKFGGLWAFGINFIGCPFACFYIAYKVWKGATLQIS